MQDELDLTVLLGLYLVLAKSLSVDQKPGVFGFYFDLHRTHVNEHFILGVSDRNMDKSLFYRIVITSLLSLTKLTKTVEGG